MSKQQNRKANSPTEARQPLQASVIKSEARSAPFPKNPNNQIPFSFSQQQHLMDTAAQLLTASKSEEVWSIIITAVQNILAADRAAIFLYNKSQQNQATCPAAIGLSEGYIEVMCELVENAPSHLLWTEQKPIIINNINEDSRTDLVRQQMIAEGFQTVAIFPLITAEQQLLGTLIAYRDKMSSFSIQDSAAGQTLAHMSALALQNIQHFNETRLNLIREKHLNHFTRTLARATDMPTILGLVIQTAANIIDADAGLLGLVIDHQVMTFYPHNIPVGIVLRPLPRGRGVSWKIVQENKTVIIDDYPSHYLAQDRWVKVGVLRLLGVPITVADNPIGTLILMALRPSQKKFNAREVALVESIGYQAGIAIQNSRMFAEADQRTTALRNTLNRQAELDDLKNKFVQTVSHELRTPLGIIHGHSELLAQQALGKLEPQQAESIDIIQRRVRMLIDLVNDLTALLAAETQELRREDINPADLAYSMLDEYRLQAQEARVQLKAEIAEDLPLISGDITHLRRVFDNLVANAFKFTPEDGLVTIRLWSESNKVFIEVSDTGIGISADKLHQIFNRFYQVDASSTHRKPGTGLGLALVKEIVEAHRGEVSVTSKVGIGTTFTVTIPATV